MTFNIPPRSKFILPLSLLAITATSALLVANCGGGGSSNTVAGKDGSYQGLGSIWTASFTTSGAFSISYDSNSDGDTSDAGDFVASGTYVEYTNKFRKLTVTSVTGTAGPSVGDEAYGLEIPGFAFFLKPIGTGNSGKPPIVMLTSGTCPTSTFSGNWVKISFSTLPDNSSADGFGSATFTSDGSGGFSGAVSKLKFEDGTSLGSGSTGSTSSCSSGALTFTGGTMFMTANNGALVDSAGGKIFAAPQNAADWTIADTAGTFSGLVAFSNSSSVNSNQVMPARITFDSSTATATGKAITDVETDTIESSGGVTMASLSAIAGSKGLFKGRLTNVGGGASNLPFNCTTATVSGSTLVACNGASDAYTGSAYATFFFLGVKR